MTPPRVRRPWGILVALTAFVAAVLWSDRALMKFQGAPLVLQIGRVTAEAEAEQVWQWEQAEDAPRRAFPLADSLERSGQWEAADVHWRALLAENERVPEAWRRAAANAAQRGDWRTASARYRTALDLDSTHAASWINFGVAAVRSGKYATGRKAFQQARAIDPESGTAALNEAITAGRLDDWQSGKAILRGLTDRGSMARRAKVWAHLGQAHRALNAPDSARMAYEQAIALAPQLILPRLGLAQLTSDPKQRLVEVEKMARLEPDRALIQFVLGQTLMALGRLEEAAVALERAVDLAPYEHDITAELMSYYLEHDRTETARKFLASSPEKSALAAVHAFLEGKVLSTSGDWEAAVGAYDEALRLSDGEYPEAWLNRGVVLRRLGRNAEALGSYEAALRAQPHYPEAWYNAALLHLDEGRIGEAIAAYERCLALRPSWGKAWFNLGALHSAVGALAAAEAAWERAVAAEGGMRDAWFNLGIVRRKLGKFDAAIAAYDSLLRREPGDYRAWFNRAIAAQEQGDDALALGSYLAAIAANPGYAKAHQNLGVLYHDLGQPEAALNAHREAVALDPQDVGARFNFALQLERQGQRKDAVLAYEQCLNLDPNYTKALPKLEALYGALGDGRNRMRVVDLQRSDADVERMAADSLYALARALHRADLQGRAVVRYAAVVEREPDGVWPRYWQAKAYEELGARDAALAGYSDLLARRSDHKFALYRSAMLLAQAGKLAEARARWGQLAALYPTFAAEKSADAP